MSSGFRPYGHLAQELVVGHLMKGFFRPGTMQRIGVTLNTYTHLGLEDAAEELRRMEEAEAARREQEKLAGKTKDSQKLFKAV